MKKSKTLSPYTKSLIDSFKICAPLSGTIPQRPLSAEEAPGVLIQEARLQTQHALIELLYKHYGLNKGRLWRKLEIADSGSIDTSERCFSVRRTRGKIKRNDLKEIDSGIQRFEEDFLNASVLFSGVKLVVPKPPEIFAISYTDMQLFEVTDYMHTTFHPRNKQALSHLYAAAHVIDRLYTQLPANRLC